MVKNSLKEYLESKASTAKIGISTSFLTETLHDRFVSMRSSRELHAEVCLRLPLISDCLVRIGYEGANSLLFHLENPADEDFSQEYTRFLEWSSIPRSKPHADAIRKIAQSMGVVKSLFFLGESIGMDEVNSCVDMVVSFAEDTCETVRDVLQSRISGMELQDNSILVCAMDESRCKMATSDGSLLVERCGGRMVACEASGARAAEIARVINESMNCYRTMFFSVENRKATVVSEDVRRMYLGLQHGNIAECLHTCHTESEPGWQTWSMSVKSTDVVRCLGCYWLTESARPRIVRVAP